MTRRKCRVKYFFMEISEKLKLIRKAEGYTQVELAKIIKVDARSLQRFEAGVNEPKYEKIKNLCKAHPEYAYWLLTDKIDPPKHIGYIE